MIFNSSYSFSTTNSLNCVIPRRMPAGLPAAATRRRQQCCPLPFALHAARQPILGSNGESNEPDAKIIKTSRPSVEIKNSHIPLSNTTYHTTLKINQKVVYTTQIPVKEKHWSKAPICCESIRVYGGCRKTPVGLWHGICVGSHEVFTRARPTSKSARVTALRSNLISDRLCPHPTHTPYHRR